MNPAPGRIGTATTERLEELIDTGDIDDVIITLPWDCRDKIVSLVETCEEHGVRARIVPDMFQMSLNRVDLESLNGIPLIGVRESSIEGWPYRLKRGLDLLLSATFLVLFSWFLLLIAAAIKLNSHGPVLFRQTRVGRDGRQFILRHDGGSGEWELAGLVGPGSAVGGDGITRH